MASNQEKEEIILKSSLTRKDIIVLTGLNYKAVTKIFLNMRESILKKLRKDDPDFEFYNVKYIPTTYALPYLKKYGVDKEIILLNADRERSVALEY